MSVSENKKLRYLLWAQHPCLWKYGDDGEMQCGACGIDFKRDSASSIEEKFYQRGLRILKYKDRTKEGG